MNGSRPGEAKDDRRDRLWEYYDRRVTERQPGIANAYAYWKGLGVEVSVEDIVAETGRLEQCLRELPPTRFVDVGAGPGTFTGFLPGTGLALDQSQRALIALRDSVPHISTIRADALRLPLADKSVGRFFAAHLYGLLTPEECMALLEEARRVASEVLILDAGRPDGVPAAEWQERTLHEGTHYQVFRRHFEAKTLATEVGGDVLFEGTFYVLVALAP